MPPKAFNHSQQVLLVALAAVIILVAAIRQKRARFASPARPVAATADAQTDIRTAYVMGLPLDVNTADAAALALVPGISPRLAERIVGYRQSHGPFHAIEELQQVKGIGSATLARIKDEIRIGPPPAHPVQPSPISAQSGNG